jgi:hypothetical protein
MRWNVHATRLEGGATRAPGESPGPGG